MSIVCEVLAIALSKAKLLAERHAVREMVVLARELEDAQAMQAQSISERRVARGEAPPKLSRSVKEMLGQLAQDQVRAEAEALAGYIAMASAPAVLLSLRDVVEQDFRSNESLLKYYSPMDRELAEAVQARRKALLTRLSEYCAVHAEG